MASLDLDPMFRRGLRLLHSRNRDSADQLKSLLDEAIRQRQGKTLPAPKVIKIIISIFKIRFNIL